MGRKLRRSRLLLRTAAAVVIAAMVMQPGWAGAMMDTTLFAGTGTAGDAGDGGAAVLSLLRSPVGLGARSSGRVFIADAGNHRVRVVNDGVISAFAGTGARGYAGDGGPASSALLDDPVSVAVLPSGGLYIADAGSHTVRLVENGVISTRAGRGLRGYTGDGEPAEGARLDQPSGVAVRPSGELYIADSGNHVIRKVDRNGIITTVAGSGVPGYSGDGQDATSARLRTPVGVAVTSAGELYIADSGNHVIRKVDRNGIISTVAGSGVSGYSGDGQDATSARLRTPVGVAVASDRELYIADSGNHVIRKVDRNGIISTVAGTAVAGDGANSGPAEDTPLNDPRAVALASGKILVAETGGHRVRLLSEANPPPPPVLTATTPPSPTNHNEPRVRGQAAVGSSVQLHTDPDCSSPVAASGSATAFASPGLAVKVDDDTVTSYYGVSIDAFGRRSTCSGPLMHVEDSTPPPAPRIVTAPRDGGGGTTAWTVTPVDGASTACQLTRDGRVVWAYTDCPIERTFDVLGQPPGHYIFTATAIDAAGNTGPPATSSVDVSSPSPTKEEVSPSPPRDGAAPPPAEAPEQQEGAQASPPAEKESPAPLPPTDSADEPQSDATAQLTPGGRAPTARPNAAATPTSRVPAAATPSGGTGLPRLVGQILGPLASDALTVSRAVATNPGLPISLITAVALFLAVQHRIDHSDPKLALAPVHAAELDFQPLLPVRPRPNSPTIGSSSWGNR